VSRWREGTSHGPDTPEGPSFGKILGPKRGESRPTGNQKLVEGILIGSKKAKNNFTEEIMTLLNSKVVQEFNDLLHCSLLMAVFYKLELKSRVYSWFYLTKFKLKFLKFY